MATYTDKLVVVEGGDLQQVHSTDSIAISGALSVGSLGVNGNVAISGDLNVTGAIVSHGVENVLVSDPYIGLAANNESNVATSGGFTLTMKKATGFIPVASVSFSAGAAAGPGPRVVLSAGGGASLAVDDIIQVSGASEDSNDGLYAVESVVGDTITVRGVGSAAVPAYAKFLSNQFVASSDSGASVVKVDLAVFAVSDGNLYSGAAIFPVGTPCFIYAPSATLPAFDGGWSEFGGDVSLQEAYNAGQAIVLNSAKGPFAINRPIVGTAAINLESNADSVFSVSGGSLTLETELSGDLEVVSAGALDIQATSALALDSSGGPISIGSDLVAQTLNLGTGGTRFINIGSISASDVAITSAGDWSADVASLAFNAGDSSSISVDGNDAVDVVLNLSASNAGDGYGVLALTSDQLVYDAGGDFGPAVTATGNEVAINSTLMLGAAGNPGQAGIYFNIGTAATTGVEAGHLVYLGFASGTPFMGKCENCVNNNLAGVSQTTAEADPTVGNIVTIPGSIVLIKFEPGTATVPSAPVYVSSTPGCASQSIPESCRVYRVGVLVDTTPVDGLYPVLYMPQLIADL